MGPPQCSALMSSQRRADLRALRRACCPLVGCAADDAQARRGIVRAAMHYTCATTGSEAPMAPRSTSFRLSDEARRRLSERAEREGLSVTALLERLIVEGVDTLDHPGIVYRGPAHARRAALAAGPDVWEIVARLRELDRGEEERIAALAAESDLHPRQIRTALEFAARHPDDVEARIARNEQAIAEGRRAAEQRQTLLA